MLGEAVRGVRSRPIASFTASPHIRDQGAPGWSEERSHSVAYRITGHSNLSAPTIPLVADEIRAELAQHDPATLVGVSCLARGADQVFARVVLE
ncbi:hypothetical protein [Thermocrispum sp.]|uniref:Uncharacterized protein n=1 Tax=Thermocrispum agreste TaxID=37925 RepID=A0ABD6FG77_9PSEU